MGTPSLHLVPFCQLCTPQNSLHAYGLNEQGTQVAHSTVLHIKDGPYLPCSAAINLTAQQTPSIAYALHSFCIQSRQTNIRHAQYSNYIAATHNITHSPCTSKCTTHPPLPTPLQKTHHICASSGKMAQDVGMV